MRAARRAARLRSPRSPPDRDSRKLFTPTHRSQVGLLGVGALMVGLFGWRGVRVHKSRPPSMQRQLARAEKRAFVLRQKLLRLGQNVPPPRLPPRAEVRIWMDGAFDMMHYGHVNAFRQGRALGTHLVVGVNSDESITQCKGPPIMNDPERLATIEACKFVDEVVPNVPYVMDGDYLDWVIKAFRIDYVVHGDDPCIVDGKDVYESAKRVGDPAAHPGPYAARSPARDRRPRDPRPRRPRRPPGLTLVAPRSSAGQVPLNPAHRRRVDDRDRRPHALAHDRPPRHAARLAEAALALVVADGRARDLAAPHRRQVTRLRRRERRRQADGR